MSTLLVNNNVISDFNVNKISLLEYVMLTVTLALCWIVWMIKPGQHLYSLAAAARRPEKSH